MNEYLFEYWYRYGNFQKEFDQESIISETEEKAREIVKTLKRWIITGSIKLISINGVKVKVC